MLVILPVVHNGRNGKTIGGFLRVVWENMTEPILMGRELLGWPKIYADLPPARKLNDTWQTIATWHGFQFAEINVKNTHALNPAELQEREKISGPNAGLISHKFILKTGAVFETDADCLAISTNDGAKAATYREVLGGQADIRFVKGTWEQLPTMVHIVEKLADLEIKEVYDAAIATFGVAAWGQRKPSNKHLWIHDGLTLAHVFVVDPGVSPLDTGHCSLPSNASRSQRPFADSAVPVALTNGSASRE